MPASAGVRTLPSVPSFHASPSSFPPRAASLPPPFPPRFPDPPRILLLVIPCSRADLLDRPRLPTLRPRLALFFSLPRVPLPFPVRSGPASARRHHDRAPRPFSPPSDHCVRYAPLSLGQLRPCLSPSSLSPSLFGPLVAQRPRLVIALRHPFAVTRSRTSIAGGGERNARGGSWRAMRLDRPSRPACIATPPAMCDALQNRVVQRRAPRTFGHQSTTSSSGRAAVLTDV